MARLFSNLWKVTTVTIFTQMQNTKLARAYKSLQRRFDYLYCQILRKLSNNCQRLLKCWLFGEFSQNLVTLTYVQVPHIFRPTFLVHRDFYNRLKFWLPWPTTSVTILDEIEPLWQNLNSPWPFLWGLFLVLIVQDFEPTLAKFTCYLSKFLS